MQKRLKRTFAAIAGLWVLIWVAYSNSLTASWHLDDYQNIVRNPKIHLDKIDADSLKQTLFAGTSDKLYRPVPMISFALNWYVGGANVLGYHIVNISVHCLNALLLYLVILNLLQTRRMGGTANDVQNSWIALAAVLLWALNPVQTQAVTYIVQRMASMAALFYLLGIYLFLKYKQAASTGSRRILIGAILIAYLLAILSKENAVLFPVGIFLIQAVFFNPHESPLSVGKIWVVSIGLTLLMGAIGLLGIYIEYGDPLAFIDMLYANRPFTAVQRLLTQPRVVLYYLSLLFFPVPWRLSVSHDIAVSTSLLSPLTTLPAIVAVVAIIGLCIAYHRKKPLICFAGLFFFLNHAVESTILPLELVFEHRNYLPSFFLFLPLAHGVARLTRDSLYSQKYGRYIVVGSSCIAIGLLGNWTFARNLVWLTEKSLWEDEMSKHPQLSRPHHNLAWAHHQPRGEYEQALDLYKKALSLKSHSRFETASTLNNLGRILYLKGDFEQALTYLEQSVEALPQRRLAEYQIVMSLIQLDRWQEAQKQIDSALRHNPEEPFFLKLKGILLSLKGDEQGAAAWLRKSLKYNPYAIDTRAHLSLVLSRMGLYEEAVEVVSGSPANEIGDPVILMALCEIEKHRGNLSMSDEYLNRLIGHQGIENVTKMLLSWRKDKLSLDIDYDHYLMTIDE